MSKSVQKPGSTTNFGSAKGNYIQQGKYSSIQRTGKKEQQPNTGNTAILAILQTPLCKQASLTFLR